MEFELIKDKIGYYKYGSNVPNIANCILEYPITDEILEHIKKTGKFKIEMIDSEPKKINDMYVVLV